MKLFDFSKYDELLPSWKILYYDEVRPIVNLDNILKKVFVCDEKYYPLLLSYLCCNSAISKQLPILFVYGRKGSGKSTLGYFASKLWGTTVHTSADTVAAIRTHLDHSRVAYIENTHRKSKDESTVIKVEKHCGLILDDVDDKTFLEKPDLYRMFKCGYDRNSSVISLMDMNRQVIKFQTFSAKILSSIKPLHTILALDELHRRLLVVTSNPLPASAKVDSARGKDFIQLTDYQWAGFNEVYYQFWGDESFVKQYVSIRQQLSRQKLPFMVSQKTLLLDIISTSVAIDIFLNLDEAIEYWEYIMSYSSVSETPKNSLVSLIQEYLNTT